MTTSALTNDFLDALGQRTGIRVEFYGELDQMKDEALGYYEPRPWHEDRPQRPKDWLGHNSPRNKWIPSAP